MKFVFSPDVNFMTDWAQSTNELTNSSPHLLDVLIVEHEGRQVGVVLERLLPVQYVVEPRPARH